MQQKEGPTRSYYRKDEEARAGDLIHRLMNHKRPWKHGWFRDQAPSLIAVGPRDSGKSTFARICVKNILGSGKCDSVAFLEGDVGQTECSPPGMVGIYVLKSPLEGRPHEHLRTPRRAHFLGVLSVQPCPEVFALCVTDLIRDWVTHLVPLGIPLVVNTHGWIAGIGLTTTLQITKMLCPDLVVEMGDSWANLTGPLVKEGNEVTRLWDPANPCPESPWARHLQWQNPNDWDTDRVEFAHISLIYCGKEEPPEEWDAELLEGKKDPARTRSQSLEAYFYPLVAAMEASLKAQPGALTFARTLQYWPPYEVKLSSLWILCMEVVTDSWEALVRAIDCSLVGILQGTTDSGPPPPGMGQLATPDPARFRTLGLGVVRAIDPDKDRVWIVSPLGLDVIKKSNALMLSRNVSLPGEWVLGSGEEGAPFTSVVAPLTTFAGAMMSSGIREPTLPTPNTVR